jgi:ubiquinone/menaquinone biosynthesis C-methylase UbiE
MGGKTLIAMASQRKNVDLKTIEGFGDEWSRFDQSELSRDELETMFENYFHIFPWDKLPKNAVGFDLGCGSGRWARLVAPRVGKLHLIDPSEALDVAKKNLADQSNCEFHRASVDEIPLEMDSCDLDTVWACCITSRTRKTGFGNV